MADEVLRVLHGTAPGTDIPVGDELVLGRSGPGAAHFTQDTEISRVHARVRRQAGGGLVLEDLGSTNGTHLNGWRIPTPQLLSAGDRIQVGHTLLELVASGRDGQTRRNAVVSGLHGVPQQRPPEAASVLYVTGVKKSYGDHSVLRGVDLEIQPGEIVGLLGPNGAGKTTLVSIIAGLIPANEGSVHISGVDVFRDPRGARRHLGLAPQELGIYPTQTVRRNLTFAGQLNAMDSPRLEQRVEEVAHALSLTSFLEKKAGALSGGQKRRVHTGMAMLHEPALLILDEPTVGADIRTRQEILEAVKVLAAEGRAICYSTHYLPEIEELGASVAILDGGQIVARGSIAQLVRDHGGSAVEVRFEGPAPRVGFPGDVTIQDSILRVSTEEPDGAAPRLLEQLGPDRERVLSVDVIRPSLDSVYLALTKKRYSDVQPVPYLPQGLTPLAQGLPPIAGNGSGV